MFLERLQRLIADKKITKNKMLTDLNLGKNSFVNWQNRGTTPNGETLSKIADYFGCSVDYLLGITDFDDETNRYYCEVFSNYFDTIPDDERDASFAFDEALISRIRRLDYKFTHDSVRKMCDYFRIPSDCAENDITRCAKKHALEKEEANKPLRVPVLGYVAAGIPITAIEDILDYEELDPNRFNSYYEYFALKIKGDSMMPRIQSGDVVIARIQPTVDSGDIAIVRIDGEEATCKQIQIHKDGVSLVSFNPAYEPMFFSNKEVCEKPVTILGKVVELRAKF